MNNNSNSNLLVGLVVIIILGIIGFVAWGYFYPSSGTMATSTPSGTSGGTTTGNVSTNTAGVPIVTTDSGAVPSNSTAVVTGMVVPDGAQTSYWYEYGKTTALGSKTSAQTIGSGYQNISAPGYITGLAADTQYYFRLVAKNSFGTVNGTTRSFTTNESAPPPATTAKVQTAAATGVARTSADVNGSVNPDGAATSYWFEYGETTDFGNTTDLRSAGNGTAAAAVSASLSGLNPATKYYFRLNAQNKFGTTNGSTLSFTTNGPAAATAPSATTGAATAVATTSATFHGTVNPNGADTTYWFEYSDSSLLGSVVAQTTPTQSLSAGTTGMPVTASVSGLASGTLYHFRLVASNSHGTTKGDVVDFTTQ